MKYQTALVKVAADGLGSDKIYSAAVTILRSGGLVAFPSETVYGLGADALRADAVAAIFAAKNRPADNPLIVHVGDLQHARKLVEDPHGRLEKLASAFWPGPLTVVLPRRAHVDPAVSRGLNTLALRVPDHGVALRLIRESGCALAAPSANLSGRPSPTQADHVLNDLSGRIPMILDAGPCQVGIESTVVDISNSTVRILRPGQVQAEALEKVLGEPVTRDAGAQKHRSPGTRYRHYRPQAPVWVVDPRLPAADWSHLQKQLQAFRWGYGGQRELDPGGRVVTQLLCDGAKAFARDFYAALRQFDANGAQLILIDKPELTGLGTALWDRLKKAAEGELCHGNDVEALLAKIPSNSTKNRT